MRVCPLSDTGTLSGKTCYFLEMHLRRVIMRTSFRCPTTAELVNFNLKDDAKSVRGGWSKHAELLCPHCGRLHAARY